MTASKFIVLSVNLKLFTFNFTFSSLLFTLPSIYDEMILFPYFVNNIPYTEPISKTIITVRDKNNFLHKKAPSFHKCDDYNKLFIK